MNIKAIVLLTAVALLVGCKNDKSAFTPVSDPQEAAGVTSMDESQSQPELVPVLRKAQPAKPAVRQQAKPTQQPAVKQQPAPYQKGEKIYVETDGAQGRVWGYVVMNGDRGTGTIHDWDENTWAVNVTRHGNELFAVDQNSRQYVFKLKK